MMNPDESRESKRKQEEARAGNSKQEKVRESRRQQEKARESKTKQEKARQSKQLCQLLHNRAWRLQNRGLEAPKSSPGASKIELGALQDAILKKGLT
jgi:hypothetical protein